MLIIAIIIVAVIAVFVGNYFNIKRNIDLISSTEAFKEAIPRTIVVIMIIIGIFLIYKEFMNE